MSNISQSGSNSSLSSDDSYVYVSFPDNKVSEDGQLALTVGKPPSDSGKSRKMNSQYSMMESGVSSLTYQNRRRANLCRSWKSLSRFQRTLVSGVILLFICSSSLILATYYRTSNLQGQLQTSVVNIPSQGVLNSSGVRRNLPTFPVPNFSGPQNERQRAIVDAFKHAWRGYKTYAWGHDHLRPLSRTSHEWFGLGLTIVDSLDTMLVMGLQNEYAEAKEWVARNLTFENNKYVNLFETTIRVLGGLLSAYHLSGEPVFYDKAKQLGDRLTGAFETPSKMPYSDVNLQTRKARAPSWSQYSSLSEISTLQLEFRDLSRVTGNSYYEQISYNVSLYIHRLGCEKFEGLCPMFMNPKTGQWNHGETITLGARADSYYEYLLKQWIQTGKTIDWLRDDYVAAMAGMVKYLVRQSEPNKLTFVGEVLGDRTYSPKMDHLVCFLAGTLALGTENGLSGNHSDLAKQLAHTCHEMYRNPTGLGPEIAHFNMLPGVPNQEDIIVKPLDAHCLLRPEAIEGWFYLYRFTGDSQYQDWGWQAFQAIETYAKIATGGYSSVNNVKKVPVSHKDMMESFYLSETLKYLYLLMDDTKTVLPLDKWVFNTEGHPLPIRTR